MKKFFIVIASLAVLGAITVGIVFYLTSGASKAADSFFLAVKEGKLTEATTYLSKSFLQNTDEQALISYLERSGLNDIESSTWSSRSMKSGRVNFEGTVVTKTGATIPVSISFVKEDDAYKIYSIDIQEPGFGTQDNTGIRMPPADVQIGLVKAAINIFSQSVAKQSMGLFYEQISEIWKGQTTVEKLNEAFAPFFKLGDSLLVLQQNTPTLTNVSLDDNGVLKIEGNYPLPENIVSFTQKFITESGTWKLFGLSVDLFH